MANRSYLYTTDDYTATGADFKATGLSEYPYGISYVYQLLVSYDTKSIKSKIFDEQEETAIVGDFEKGKQMVIDYLKMVRALALDYMDEGFEDFVDETIAFLNARTAKYVLLENYEIYSLDDDSLADQQEEFIALAQQDREAIEKILEAYKKGNLTEDSLDDEASDYLNMMEDDDVEDFWTDVLYYDLSGEGGDGEE